MSTPNTGIPYVPEGTQDPAAGLNLALNVIDALLQTAVIDMSLTAPPGSPSDGDLYIVASGATGAWAGQDNNLARYVADGDFWQFYEAGTNVHIVLNLDDGGLYAWTGSTWAPAVAGAGSGTVTSVDVSADTSIADVFDTSGGPVTSSGSVSITAVDAGADRIVFWDDSESKLRYLEVGSNLSITGTVLNATGGGGPTSWGSITGTLSDQADLQSALDGKAGAAALNALESRVTATEGAISALVGYIDGLCMELVSGTSLRVTGGAAYIPGLNGILGVESPITKSGLSLSANTWYHLYLYRNGGSADIEISTTAPAEPYSGTARTKSGDTSRRYIGSVVTDDSGAIYSFSMSGNSVFYGGDYIIYPKLRVLSYGTASDWTAFSFADVVPVTARMLTLALVNTGTAAFRVRPTFGAWTGTSRLYGLTANATSIVQFPVDSNLQGAYQCAPGGTGVVDVAGYTVER